MKIKVLTHSMKSFTLSAVLAVIFAPASFCVNANDDPGRMPVKVENNLDEIMLGIEESLKYKAPVEFESEWVKELGILAEQSDELLKYKAPANPNEDDNTLSDGFSRPVKVEVYRNPSEAWLIEAGYFKSERTPAWTRIKRIFQNERADDHFASQN